MNTDRKLLPMLCVLAAVVIATPLLQGCISTSKIENPSVSLGQQLQDLEKAHQNGTISDKEYKELRKSIINKYK
jgi:outer membrane murein-binding lipoprotein Lpp